MAKNLITFHRDSAARIAAAVRAVEQTPGFALDKTRPLPTTLGRDRWFGKTAVCAEFPTYPTAAADTYVVQLLERWYTEVPGSQDYEDIVHQQFVVAHYAAPEGERIKLDEGTEVDCWKLPTRRGWRWWFRPLIRGSVGGCLAENHPGRGLPFNIHLGIWMPSAHRWLYDETSTVKAIDWRHGVPTPDAGSTGLFEARASDSYGAIWEVLDLDCSTPGACYYYYGDYYNGGYYGD